MNAKPPRRMPSRRARHAERERGSAPRRPSRMRALKIAGLAVTVCAAMSAVLLAGALLYVRSQSLPAAGLGEPSVLLDRSGRPIGTIAPAGSRRPVALRDMSPYVVQATLAIEDKRFYEHGGVDLRGLARAVLVNVESGAKRQGASTLTQQLARNLYLTHERTWSRKLKEAAYAVQLETHFSKDEILAMYLNRVYYGHGAYGVEAAAQLYFGKSASQLSLAESAMLAGIPKGPAYYSPFLDMKNAKERQRLILGAMAEQGMVTKAEADRAGGEVLAFRQRGAEADAGTLAPYFRDYVRIAAEKLGIGAELLESGGLRIYTTLDPETQRAAEEAIGRGIPSGSEQQAALVAIDPRNGYVKAMVGGRDYRRNPYNRAFAAVRQPGSAFKPILYLTALESGGMTPVTRFRSEPTVFTYDEGRKTYEPRNHNDKYANDWIDMRQAIASSDNTYAVNAIMAVGPEKVIEKARSLGITSALQPVPSLALGTFPVSPFEMASAFGVLANRGVRAEPTAIVRIEDAKGEALYTAHPNSRRVTDPAHAYVLTSLLESVFDTGGTGYRVSAAIKRPVAGKTGTTASDAWLVGYTPELATAVWTGYDKGRSLSQAEAHRAAPIFAAFTEKALEAVPPKIFTVPDGVSLAYIDPGSGKLAGSGCAERRLEAFVAGTEPAEAAPACAESGKEGETDGAGDGPDGGHGGISRRGWWRDLRRWWTE